MSIKIAIAGKGGTGKTTISSLIIRNLIAKKNGSVLALDADPNSNLNELLGIDITSTVGQMVESFKKDGAKLSSGLYKDQMVEMNIHKSVIEGNGFDLLVMGRGEGPGCYCAANNLFKKYIDMLQESYKYIVMDNEAGMEHLSRKTTNNVDILLIVSDPSPRGILTAARLRDLAKELSINAKKAYLVLNRVDSLIDARLLENIKKYDLEMIASINSD
jgi:CO dehydrogenase maturation factor